MAVIIIKIIKLDKKLHLNRFYRLRKALMWLRTLQRLIILEHPQIHVLCWKWR